MPLALSNLTNPLFWALFIGWILSVVLHEFAHGLVAAMGGDYTIRERGGLSLNPLQYVDPVMSIILPLLFLLLGGVPLPGGVTYVRTDLLRSRLWESAVSAAGPCANVIIFLLCVLPLHPHFGWVDPAGDPREWTNGQMLLAALAILQLLSVCFNLLPVPPLDGFGIIRPWLGRDLHQRLMSPAVSLFMMGMLFMVLAGTPGLRSGLFEHIVVPVLRNLGFRYHTEFFRRSYNLVVIGSSD